MMMFRDVIKKKLIPIEMYTVFKKPSTNEFSKHLKKKIKPKINKKTTAT